MTLTARFARGAPLLVLLLGCSSEATEDTENGGAAVSGASAARTAAQNHFRAAKAAWSEALTNDQAVSSYNRALSIDNVDVINDLCQSINELGPADGEAGQTACLEQTARMVEAWLAELPPFTVDEFLKDECEHDPDVAVILERNASCDDDESCRTSRGELCTAIVRKLDAETRQQNARSGLIAYYVNTPGASATRAPQVDTLIGKVSTSCFLSASAALHTERLARVIDDTAVEEKCADSTAKMLLELNGTPARSDER